MVRLEISKASAECHVEQNCFITAEFNEDDQGNPIEIRLSIESKEEDAFVDLVLNGADTIQFAYALAQMGQALITQEAVDAEDTSEAE